MISGSLLKVTPIITGLIDNFGGLDKVIVKVGVGFASLKLMQVAGGIRSLISGIGLLKAGLGGLAMGGLGLILEDIVYHFMGGGSLIFDDILPKLKELKDDFNISINTDQFKELADEFKKLWDNTEGFRKALASITEVLIVDALESITDSINGLSAAVTFAMKLFNAFAEGGFTGGMEFIMESIKESNDPEKEHPVLDWFKNAWGVTEAIMNPKKAALKYVSEGIANYAGKKADDSANDAIISPSGRITKLSPDDWVFAVKDIADLAGGLMPAGVNTTNNNMNAPANYVINQSFSIGAGVRASEVRAQAYRGTSEALQSNLSNASKIMQLMPGTR
jgi:hypothetical protein